MIPQSATLVAYLVDCTLSILPYFPLVIEREKIKINDLDQFVTNNIKSNHVNDIIENELKFDIGNILVNNPMEDPLYIANLSLRVGKILDRH